jgi:hypothetical protein
MGTALGLRCDWQFHVEGETAVNNDFFLRAQQQTPQGVPIRD